jgi:hypothetical protein
MFSVLHKLVQPEIFRIYKNCHSSVTEWYATATTCLCCYSLLFKFYKFVMKFRLDSVWKMLRSVQFVFLFPVSYLES